MNNWKLSLYGVKNVYTLHEPLSGEALERDFGKKSWFQYPIPAFKPESEIVFIPDRDICYYVSPEDTEPVAILKAGEWYRVTETGIQYAHSSYQYHEGAGIGIRTWPTQNKEWRYAIPVSYTHLDVYKRQFLLCVVLSKVYAATFVSSSPDSKFKRVFFKAKSKL